MAEEAPPQMLSAAFHREGQQRLVGVLMALLVINFCIVCGLGYFLTHPQTAKFYATSVNNKVMPLTPLNEPNQSDTAVGRWANQAAIACFTYDFLNYEHQFELASAFFTSDGWEQFLGSLTDSNNIEALRSKKLIVAAVATRMPVILEKGELNGVFSWRIQIPILITYQSASEIVPKHNIITMLIQRISTRESSKGIGISQFMVGVPAVGAGK